MKKLRNTGAACLMLLLTLVQAAPAALAAAPVSAGSRAAAPGGRDIIKEIIDVVGLQPRFQVQEAEVENAAAVIYGGQRYILYNRQFLAAVNNAVKTDWAAVSILAHEIGHHLNGHTLSRGGSNPSDELEADEFSGFVLRKMGASLSEAQAAISLLSEERSSHTHPGRSVRLASISKGWNNADEQAVAGARVRPSNKPQPSRQPESQPAYETRPERVAASPSLRSRPVSQRSITSRDIMRKVNLRALPGEEIYVTRQLELVRVNEGGRVEIIGKMARTNSRSYPYVLQSSYFDALLVGADGYLRNQNGQRIGYLS
ncbi:MAG: membrane-binding protein [Adhaeribacter sp.]